MGDLRVKDIPIPEGAEIIEDNRQDIPIPEGAEIIQDNRPTAPEIPEGSTVVTDIYDAAELAPDPEQAMRKIDDAYVLGMLFGDNPSVVYDHTDTLKEALDVMERDEYDITNPVIPGLWTTLKQSFATKAGMMVTGLEPYTPGRMWGADEGLRKTSEVILAQRDPSKMKDVMESMQGPLFFKQPGAKWDEFDPKLWKKTLETWAYNFTDFLPLLIMTGGAPVISRALAGVIAGGAGMATGGPEPTDVATVPAVYKVAQPMIEFGLTAGPMILLETGHFMDEARRYGIDPDIAEKHSRRFGPASGTVETAQRMQEIRYFKKLTSKVAKKLTVRVLRGMGEPLWEGVEEVLQGELFEHYMGKAIDEQIARDASKLTMTPEEMKAELAAGREREFWIGAGIGGILKGTGSLTRAAFQGMTAKDKAALKYYGYDVDSMEEQMQKLQEEEAKQAAEITEKYGEAKEAGIEVKKGEEKAETVSNADEFIQLIEEHKRPQGDLDQGLDYFTGMAQDLSPEDLSKVIEWTRGQSEWIHRFLGGDIDALLRSKPEAVPKKQRGFYEAKNITPSYGEGKPVYTEVFVNPNRKEIEAIRKQGDTGDSIRVGISTASDDVYIWRSDVLHEDIDREIAKHDIGFEYVPGQGLVELSPIYDIKKFSEEQKTKVAKLVKRYFPDVETIRDVGGIDTIEVSEYAEVKPVEEAPEGFDVSQLLGEEEVEDVKPPLELAEGLTTVKSGDLGPGIESDESVEEIKNEIFETQKVMPISITKDGFIVDGEHTYKALMDLGVKDIPVYVGEQEGVSGRLKKPYPGLAIDILDLADEGRAETVEELGAYFEEQARGEKQPWQMTRAEYDAQSERLELDKDVYGISYVEVDEMLTRAYRLSYVQDYYDTLYDFKNSDPREIALTVESDYELYNRYLKNVPEDVGAQGIIEAYQKHELPAERREKAHTPSIEIPRDVKAAPLQTIGEPKKVAPLSKSKAKTVWSKAVERVTPKNKAEITDARTEAFKQYVSDQDFPAKIGLKESEINKKMRTWANIPAEARRVQNTLNQGRPFPAQWHGISNSTYIDSMTYRDIDAMVGKILVNDNSWYGKGGASLRFYIARALLGINTRILFNDLNFIIDSTLEPKGQYNGTDKTIRIRAQDPNTVAHEIGHHLDYKWAEEATGTRFGTASTLFDSYNVRESITPLRRQWLTRFHEFVMDISERSETISEYYQKRSEVFARFVSKFVQWVNKKAGYHTWGGDPYVHDRFYESDYTQFVRLLQEKAYVDIQEPAVELSALDKTVAAHMEQEIEGKQPWEIPRDEWVDHHIKSPGMHMEHVRRALAKGEAVPAEVLADYPEFKPTQYEERDPHRDAVERALKEGKPVPAEVLAEYPGLQQKAKVEKQPISPELQEKLDRVQKQAEKKLEKALVEAVLVEEMPSPEELQNDARILRDRAVDAWNNDMEFLNRIQELGKIHVRYFKGAEELVNIPQWVKMKVFTKEPTAMDFDKMANSMGMTDDELVQKLSEYGVISKPSNALQDYMDEARQEYRADKAEFIRTEDAKGITGKAIETGAKRGITEGKKIGAKLEGAKVREKERTRAREWVKRSVAREKARKREVEAKAKARKAKSEEIKKMVKAIKKIDTSEFDPAFAEPINSLLEGLDLVRHQKKTIVRLVKMGTYLENNPDAELPQKYMDQLKTLDKRDLNDITIEELRDLYTTIKHYVHLEKTKKRIKIGRKRKHESEVLQESLAVMKPAKQVYEEVVDWHKGLGDRIKNTGKLVKHTFGVRHNHYDLVIEKLFGINSLPYQVLYTNVKKGLSKMRQHESESASLLQGLIDQELNKVGKGIDNLWQWSNEKVMTEGINLTRQERISLWCHWQNEDNKTALIEGGFGSRHGKDPNKIYQFEEETLQKIIDGLSDEEVAIGKAVMKLLEWQGNEYEPVYLEKNGYAMPRVEKSYFPKDVMSVARAEGVDLDDQLALEKFKEKTLRLGVSKGQLEKRVGSKAAIYLNPVFHDVAKSVKRAAAYIGLEIPFSDAGKLLYNKTFRTEVSRRYDPIIWHQIEDAMKDMALEYRSYTTVEKLALKFKNNLAVAMLGLDPFIMAKQVLSFPLYAAYVKPKYLMQGMTSYLMNPKEITQRHKDLSLEFELRTKGGFSRDVADIYKKEFTRRMVGGGLTVKQALMSGIKWADKNTVAAGMQGAILQVLDEIENGKLSREVKGALNISNEDIKGLTPEQKIELAYQYADFATQRTQPMFAKEHQSSLQKGTPFEQLMTMFGSFTNQALNLLRRTYNDVQTAKTDEEKSAAWKKLAIAVFVVGVINPLGVMGINELRDKVYGREDEDEFWLEYLQTIAGYMFFVRDAAYSVSSKIKRGPFGYDINLSLFRPFNLLISSMVHGYNAITEGKKSKRKKEAWKAVDDGLNGIFMLYGAPYYGPKELTEAAIKAIEE